MPVMFADPTRRRPTSCSQLVAHGRRLFVSAALLFVLGAMPSRSDGQVPRALPDGEKPSDARLEAPKDLNGYFKFDPPETKDAWQARADNVRRQLLVSQGLWPMPEKTPLNAVIHSKIEKSDYSVEHVYFEAMPGFYVTGNLYRPTKVAGKVPGILCPHGHWANGRFYDAGDKTAEEQIAKGAEERDEAAHSPLQARCVHLARMGCVVFHYDMIGYADSQQIKSDIAHRFAKQRPDMNRDEGWGLYSPQAESHLQSVMGLQSFSSIRALDFLETLPEVDTSRLAVTGASGGGTQTFMLAAIDPRPAVAFPAVMVSTAMQGGCTCENCSLLRVETGNIEIAALFAPKPLGLSAANDWTKEMTTKGFPELQQLYKTLGQPDNVDLISRIEFNHNYNAVCRKFMYEWFNRHLGLDADTSEREFDRLSNAEMTVWNEEHAKPQDGEEFERGLLAAWHKDSQSKLGALVPESADQLTEFRKVVGGGTAALFGRTLPDNGDLEWEQTHKVDQGKYLSISGLLRNIPHDEELPLTFLYPKEWDGTAVIWLTESGKSGLLTDEGLPSAPVQSLLDQGVCVTGVDLLFQGEFLADGESHERTRRVENPREAAAYTFGYNHALFAQRVHDVLNTITFIRAHELTPQRVVLVATDQTSSIAAAARAIAQDAVDLLAIDTLRFRFGSVRDLHDPYFLPGGAKYGDLPGMLALSAPAATWVCGESDESMTWATQTYQASDAESALQIAQEDESAEDGAARFDVTKVIVQWLIEQG